MARHRHVGSEAGRAGRAKGCAGDQRHAAEEIVLNLFPLRLTPFEAVMYWDDRPEYPMVFYGELELSGRLDREALRKAVQFVLPRHPLLRAGVETREGFPHWVECTVEEYPWDHIVFAEPDAPVDYYPVGPQWQGSFRLTVTPLTGGESDYRFLFQ